MYNLLFSIIVPAYNCESYISECFDSINAQSFRDFEAIIVDDGSTDTTPQLCDSFESLHRYTTVIHQDNSGPYVARKRGLSIATGEYVVFLDADDTLRADALALIADAINASGADIVCFRWSRRQDYSTVDDLDPLPKGRYFGESYQRIVKAHACSAHFNNLCGKAFRMSCVNTRDSDDAVGKFMYAEDLAQLLPIIDAAHSLICIDSALYYYRASVTSTAVNYQPSYIENTERASSYLLDYGDRWGMRDQALNGVFTLYVGVLKPLIDYAGSSQRTFEFKRLGLSLQKLVPDIKDVLSCCRLDYRLMLRAAINNRIWEARGWVFLSHLVKKLLRLLHVGRCR